jgi:hypothetical protein
VRSKLNDLKVIEGRRFWSTVFGINGPEWMIILALADAEGCRADTTIISEMLNVDHRSFMRAHADLRNRGTFTARDKGRPQSFAHRSRNGKIGAPLMPHR